MRNGSWRLLLLGAVFFLAGTSTSEKPPNYSFMHEATRAPAQSYYDYIIVGGGTAGCPLAATLSHNATVLVLERGGTPYHNPNITHFSAVGAALSDLSPTSPSQRFVSKDGVINARARVLGGGSAINAGLYTRASQQYVRNAGWEERLVNDSYRWVEAKVAFKPRMRPWDSAVRDGLLEAGVLPNNGFTYDHITGTKIGGTIFDHNGLRHTAADLLEHADPRGITVLLHATVHRILFQTKGRTKPTARGVVFRDALGQRHVAYLNRRKYGDIIVSAGALGSPQLLMLSGIGPANHLRKHNIPVVLDKPRVGQGMSDNPLTAVFVPSPILSEATVIYVVGITRSGISIEGGGGIFSPKNGQLSAIDTMSKQPPLAFKGGFLMQQIPGPISTGHLELQTRNPNDNPSVTFNYYKDPLDLKQCVRGLQIIHRVIQSKTFSSKFKYDHTTFRHLLNLTASLPGNLLPRHGDATSASLEQFCKDTVMTFYHYHGGCHVDKVVDEKYRVVGVNRLRVIDTSTLRYCPGANPQATVMMLGRYMGVRILKEKFAAEEYNS